MELIPILSTIILVATIMTFLLAIGAYVLYKVRERKGQTAAAEYPSKVNAELVTVQDFEEEPVQQRKTRVTQTFYEVPGSEQQARRPLFEKEKYEEEVKREKESSGKFVAYNEKPVEIDKPGDIKWR